MKITKVCRPGDHVQIGTCGPYVAYHGWALTVTEPMRRLRRGEMETSATEIEEHTFRLGIIAESDEFVIEAMPGEPVEWLRNWRATEGQP